MRRAVATNTLGVRRFEELGGGRDDVDAGPLDARIEQFLLVKIKGIKMPVIMRTSVTVCVFPTSNPPKCTTAGSA